MDNEQYIALVGNPTEGYKVFGPYTDFDDAADNTEGLDSDSWIMRIMAPRVKAQTNMGKLRLTRRQRREE